MRIKKNILKISLVVLGILVFQTSNAQKNYLPGYIIDQNGEKVQGFIDYRNWEKNPDKINFKESIDGEKKEFTPTDIKEFAVKDEIYVAAIIETEVSPYKTNDLTEYSELRIVVDTAFLQTMISGVKSLYYYKTKAGKENFYILQKSKFELLVHKKFLKENKDLRYHAKLIIAQNKKYVGQLILYLNNCSSIPVHINRAEYSKKDIEKLFKFYYNCTQSKMDFQKKTEKLNFEAGALAGVSFSSLNFTGDVRPNLVNTDYSLSVNFTAGLYFDIIQSRNNGRWSFINELIYTSYKVDGTYTDFYNENRYTTYYTELGYSYLKLNSMFRLKFPIGSAFGYFNAGISNGFAISETNYKKEEIMFYTPEVEIVDNERAIEDAKSYELGYIFGLGAKYKRYSLELRYELGSGMSTAVQLSSHANRLYFILGYSF